MIRTAGANWLAPASRLAPRRSHPSVDSRFTLLIVYFHSSIRQATRRPLTTGIGIAV